MNKPTATVLEIARAFPCLEAKLRCCKPKEFNPDLFRSMMAGWSHGEILCGMFVLNVWNPVDAKQKGWDFDLLEFTSTADSENREALIRWLSDSVWP
jgi:hypothetical protein